MPTVTDVLELPVVRRGRPVVVAGARATDHLVRWVHSAEVPDIAHLLRGGDLVLTTGIALPDDDEALGGYVEQLFHAGAAGLVVELGRHWTELPPAMVQRCEELGLPLVTFGREVRFAAVSEAVAEMVVDAQLAELRNADLMHQTFTRLSVESAEPRDILAAAHRLGNVPAVLESLRHQVLGYDGESEEVHQLMADWESRSRRVRPAGRTGYDEESGWLVTVVGARGGDWGRLVLLCGEPPPSRLLVLAELAATALALQRLAARDQGSLERQTHRALLTAIDSPGDLPADVALRCAAVGVPVQGRQLVGLVVQALGSPDSSGPLAAQDRIRDLAEITAGAASTLGESALVGTLDDDFVQVLVSLPARATVEARVDRLAEAVHHAAASASLSVIVAAGSAVTDLGAARQTLAEARHIADSARTSGVSRPCHRLADVRLQGLLHLLADDQRLAAFVDRELRPIEEYDAAHGSDLLGALRAVTTHGANKSAAASSLHLSRAAFYDRLARVERVLGVSLSDPESLTSLHVAVLARDAGVGGHAAR